MTPMATPENGGERKAAQQPEDRFDGVMRQNAGNRQFVERHRDLFERRNRRCGKMPAQATASQIADDHERKNVAPDETPSARPHGLSPRLPPRKW